MALPTLNGIAPPDIERAVDAVLQTLRDDPIVGQGGTQPVTILAEEGDYATSPEVMRAPNADQLPCIRLTLGDFSLKWETEGRHRGPLPFHFELWTAGTHYADRLRLMAAFIGAIFPQEQPRRDDVKRRFNTAGFTWTNTGERLQMGSTKRVSVGADQYAQVTTATYVMTFDVPT